MMNNDDPITAFRAGSDVLPYASAAFIVIAVVLPIYFYPGFFLSGYLNFLPFVILTMFIMAYNIVQYRKRAVIEVYVDMLRIITSKKSVKMRFDEVKSITKEASYGKKLFVVHTKNGRSVALYDRRLMIIKTTLLEYIEDRVREQRK